jgi:hypothetical protein
MNSIKGRVSALVLALLAGPALAQEAPASQAPTNATPPVSTSGPTPVSVPAGAVVDLVLEQRLGSETSKRGDRFPIRLAESVKVNGVVVLPAGLQGEGEVIHAERKKMGGKPGEMLLAARFLTKDGVRIPLKALKMGSAGDNPINTIVAASMVIGPFAMFIQGGEVVIPSGTLAHAKLAAPYPAAEPAPAAASSSATTTRKPEDQKPEEKAALQ